MTWARLDDRFPQHPKVSRLSDRAFRAHVTAICHSAAFLTDGHIDEKIAKMIATSRILNELSSAGLWHKNGSGWVIHDYTEYNPSKEKVESERAMRRERAKRGANARWHAQSDASSMLVSNDAVDAPVPSPLSSTPSSHQDPDEKPDEGQDGTARGTAHAVEHLVKTIGADTATHLAILGLVARGLSEADIRYVAEQVKVRRPRNPVAYAKTALARRLKERSIA